MNKNNEKTKCQVAILAGGMGTRLKSRSGNLPKPMVPILGKPVLAHQIALCKTYGFTDIALLVHYESDIVQKYFGSGIDFGVNLSYIIETEARGTAGALRDALDSLDDRFLVLYGDTYADINLTKLWNAHIASGAQATLLLHPNDHPQDSDLVEIDGCGKIIDIHPYPHPEGIALNNLVNAALYVMEKANLDGLISSTVKSDLAKNTFPAMLDANFFLNAYITPEYIKDMGTPGRLDKVERDIVAGLPEKLSGRQPRKAVFIDRDGTINIEVNHLKSPEQFELIDGVADALRELNRSGMLAVCVTNQPVLARGDVSSAGMRAIHAKMDDLLGQGNAYIDALYLCPHHPDTGFDGEVAELKIQCNCRKPATGLIDKAVQALQISRRDSWIVGDTTSDLLSGSRSGLRTMLVQTGYAGRDAKYDVVPDYISLSLSDAVRWILYGHQSWCARLMPLMNEIRDERTILIGGPARVGKSSVAKVLTELLAQTGMTGHIISIDNWLRPVDQRQEGDGVMHRYDMDNFYASLSTVIHNQNRCELAIPQFDRKTRQAKPSRTISIGKDDILIVEGVTALLDPRLRQLSRLNFFIDATDQIRYDRLIAEYRWRGELDEEIEKKLSSREKDEVPTIRESGTFASYRWEQT